MKREMKLRKEICGCQLLTSFSDQMVAILREFVRSIGKGRALFSLIMLFIATFFSNFEESLCLIMKTKNSEIGSILETNDLILMNRENTSENGDLYLGYSGNLWDRSSILVPINYSNTSKSKSVTFKSSDLVSEPDSKLRPRRFKRAVSHLYNMLVCATGCNPLAYKGYGCYCGFLGSGFTTDGIDECCKMHDWCYDATNCPMFVEYFVPYYWKCYYGFKPICAVEHGKWGGAGSCAQRLCECDRSFAECLRQYPCPRKKAMCTSSPWRLIQNLFMVV